MTTIKTKVLAVILCFSATACAQRWGIEPVERLPRPDGDFEALLFDGYIDLARAEGEEEDWRDVDRFLSRAAALSAGDLVEPERIADRDLSPAAAAELGAARTRLVGALGRGGRVFAPVDAAASQTAFDCWMQEQEESIRQADVMRCWALFAVAIVQLEEAVRGDVIAILDETGGRAAALDVVTAEGTVALDTPGSATLVSAGTGAFTDAQVLDTGTIDTLFGAAIDAEPLPPERFIFYFEEGTAELTDASAQQIPALLAAIQARSGARLDIVGHADRVGPEPLNAVLSRRRAEQVRGLLADRLAQPVQSTVTSFGEQDPMIPTPDNVAEPRNRRVEITVR